MPLPKLNAAGQSVWYDHIHRGMITTGGLAGLIEADDLRGVTSNPAIFDKAITSTHEYDDILQQALQQNPGASSRELFFALAIEDIRDAADILRPVYDATGGVDGMISLEVSPDLAQDSEATVREAHELHSRLNRPNVMIKVPATREGIPAVAELIGSGVNVNVTLLFNVDVYRQVVQAYIRGLENLSILGPSVQNGCRPDTVASVASFFVSRVDSAVDSELESLDRVDLQGKAAIANAKTAYAVFKETFQGPRWEGLRNRGARVQRLLWASTGTKDPRYPDTMYVDQLIAPHTVNTVPPATLAAFLDHGTVRETLVAGLDEAQSQLAELSRAGIDLEGTTRRLLEDGLKAFAHSFESLISGIPRKLERLRAA